MRARYGAQWEGIMQSKNRTQSNTPKSGDGTQDTRNSKTDANWYGASQMPQEEFTDDHGNDVKPEARRDQNSKMDEGKPTFSGDQSATTAKAKDTFRNP